MSAALRELLVFDVATGKTGRFELAHRSRRIVGSTEAGIRIDDAWNLHRARDKPGQHAYLGEGEQPDIGHARSRVAQSRAADVNRIETRALHHPRRRGVEHSWHCDAAIADQLAETFCCAHV